MRDDHHLRADTNAYLFIQIRRPARDMHVAWLICEVTGLLGMLDEAFSIARNAHEMKALPLAIPYATRSGLLRANRQSEEQVRLGRAAAFVVHNTQMHREKPLPGRGVAPVFDFETKPDFGLGPVVNAPPDWSPGMLPVRAIYARERPILSPARDLVEFRSGRLASAVR